MGLADRVAELRRERKTGVEIALRTGLSRATVSRILTRLKLNRIHMLEPKLPPNRHEFDAPGDMLHIDIKKLARIHKPGHRITGNPQDETRGAGWEFLYVAVDDHSRMAYTAMMPNEKAISASLFLRQAAEYFGRHNISLRRVMTDNGPCFISDLFKAECARFRLQAHTHKNLYPQDKRKGRTVYPDCHPRVGLCPQIPELKGEKLLARSMDQPLQLPQTAC